MKKSSKSFMNKRDLYVIECVLLLAVFWAVAELFKAWRVAVGVFGPIIQRKFDRLTSAEIVRVEMILEPTSITIPEPLGSWRGGPTPIELTVQHRMRQS
jgi:hypothetical protein